MMDLGWGGAGRRDQTSGRCKVLGTNGKPKETDGLGSIRVHRTHVSSRAIDTADDRESPTVEASS